MFQYELQILTDDYHNERYMCITVLIKGASYCGYEKLRHRKQFGMIYRIYIASTDIMSVYCLHLPSGKIKRSKTFYITLYKRKSHCFGGVF